MDAPEPTLSFTEDLTQKRIFTTGEAATICKVSQQTIIRCFDSGRLTGFRVPGSKFRRIPRDELIRFMKANSIPLDVLTNGGKKRILVVDDDPAILELYRDIFGGDLRYELKSASNGYDAGMLTESFRPHLMILDFMLPDLNGDLVCRRVRENPNLAETRVLCVSGAATDSELDAVRAAGAAGCLRKPFSVDALRKQVDMLMGSQRAATA